MSDIPDIPHTSHHRVEADGVNVFYREAVSADAPFLPLLHGFPTSSFHYRELIPRLADRYHVIAPDLAGLGFTEVFSRTQLQMHFRRPRKKRSLPSRSLAGSTKKYLLV